MEIYTMTRPSMPLTRACALSALVPSAAPAAVVAAERAPVQWVHQVQIQAELAQALTLPAGISGADGAISTTSTTGFKGITVSAKRYADGGSGVPPRGRPV